MSSNLIDVGEFDDGREDDDDIEPIVLPTPGASPAALTKSQDQVQILKQRLANVRLAYSTLQARVNSKSSGKAKNAISTPINSLILEHQKLIVLYGKRWALLHEPWLDKNVFLCPLPPGAPDPLSSERFASIKAYKDGTIAELYDYFEGAPIFKELAEKLPEFRDAFVKQVNAERATSLKTIRDNLSLIFSDLHIPPELFNTKAGTDRANDPTLKSLLYKPGVNNIRNFSPIHYYRQDVKSYPFINEYQPKMIRIALFGPDSIKTPLDKFKYTSGLLGMNWGVTGVNASLIAWSAVLIRFLISPDTEFSEVGIESKIRYRENFYTYREMILQNEREETGYIKMLYPFYNERAFYGLAAPPSLNHQSEPSNVLEDIDEMSEMMARLRAADPSTMLDSDPDSHIFSPISESTPHSTEIQPVPIQVATGADDERQVTPDLDDQVSPQAVQPKRGRGRGRARGRGRGQGAQRLDAPSEPSERSTRSRTKH
ncbi:hypothetical protein VKT23_008443 [Stygiomarasmius scandens]|uniref:Uncharacterized protein n=1 Tax=Marasmiellus scandens TaxID=2682957 RepID=A0ABR1JJ97_9AGAR